MEGLFIFSFLGADLVLHLLLISLDLQNLFFFFSREIALGWLLEIYFPHLLSAFSGYDFIHVSNHIF